MKRFFGDHWQVVVSLAVLLINLGANLALLRSVRDDVSELKNAQKVHTQTFVENGLRIRELELRLTGHDARLTTTESIQRADHDALMKMAGQVERIATWVDRQEQKASAGVRN